MKYAEVSSMNDSLREEIGELQISEMKTREKSKKYKEKIRQFTKVKTECLQKIENYKSKCAKVAKQHWKINAMRKKSELIILIVGLLVGLL